MPVSPRLMLWTFGLALFSSALLLFLVQPMVGKMITPLLGGTPAVWNTCMVFFQALLLAGYAYAHASTAWLNVRRQAVLHLLVLLLPFAFFPLAVDRARIAVADHSPLVAVLLVLTLSLGVPFFVVSTSAPLLQKWLSGTAHPAAGDPYFLYGASNLGSMLALVGYPTLVEPLLTLQAQRWAWCAGYGVLAALVAACAVLLWKAAAPAKARGKKPPEPAAPGGLTWSLRLRWLALTATPSSLMLGATTYITTDLAAIPLLWVLPLALYLASFILVFARVPVVPQRWMIRALPPLILLLLFLLLSGLKPGGSAGGSIALHLAVLFVAAMVCHGALAADRPAPAHLTEFFLWVSIGGVLGGLFNALVAPLLFNSIAEYPLALLGVCVLAPLPATPSEDGRGRLLLALIGLLMLLCLPLFVRRLAGGEFYLLQFLDTQGSFFLVVLLFGAVLGFAHVRRAGRPTGAVWADVALPAALGLLSGMLTWALTGDVVYPVLKDVAAGLGADSYALRAALCLGVPLLLCATFVRRPVRFGLGVAALLLAGAVWSSDMDRPDFVFQQRSFFGVLRIDGRAAEADDGQRAVAFLLRHGTTTHGVQARDPRDEARDRRLRSEPLLYYHRAGPIGRVFATYNTTAELPFGVIGLGTGALAAYALPGQRADFFEIDPLVRDLAFGDDGYFTYAADARARGALLKLRLGDARLTLERQRLSATDRYGLLVVDAFSSDAIPVHLLTREALGVYLDQMREDGVIAFHVSNHYLDMKPVLANLAEAEHLAGCVLEDRSDQPPWKISSTWVVLARKPEHLDRLRAASGAGTTPWKPLVPNPKVGVWTDDYSNLLGVLRGL